MEDTEIIQFENDIIPFNQWIDVRDDEEFEKVKANLNDYEMVLVTSKTRSKFSMSIFTNGNFWVSSIVLSTKSSIFQSPVHPQTSYTNARRILLPSTV